MSSRTRSRPSSRATSAASSAIQRGRADNSPRIQMNNQPQDSTMKALIIYDDFYSAIKANASLQHSADKADLAVRWNIRPWRVDMLKFPPTADEALTEALDAHLIVLAGQKNR